MCLGGSTTQFKDPDGLDWPSRVEAILRRRYENDRIDVLNMGMMWYTSLHSLMNYAVNLRQAKPRAVLVMHGINDLLQNADFSYFSRGPFREDYGHFYGPLKNLIGRRGFLDTFSEMLRDFWYAKPRQIVDQTDFPGLVPFQRNIDGLIDLAEADDVQVILMTQPYLLKESFSAEEKAVFHMVNTEAIGKDKRWSVATALRGMKAYNDALREVARKRNVPLIDLEPRVPKTLEFFTDEVHYRKKAFEIIGSFVAAELIRLKIFEYEAP
jgi:GDSL-like Lipase/Acylhydrolase family